MYARGGHSYMYFDGTVIVKTSKKPYFSTAVVLFVFFFLLLSQAG